MLENGYVIWEYRNILNKMKKEDFITSLADAIYGGILKINDITKERVERGAYYFNIAVGSKMLRDFAKDDRNGKYLTCYNEALKWVENYLSDKKEGSMKIETKFDLGQKVYVVYGKYKERGTGDIEIWNVTDKQSIDSIEFYTETGEYGTSSYTQYGYDYPEAKENFSREEHTFSNKKEALKQMKKLNIDAEKTYKENYA